MKWVLVSAITILAGCKVPTGEESKTKIVGGQIVSENDSGPERASTVGLNGCTGTLVALDLVLTAAHCYNSAISGGYVVFGTSFSSNERQLVRIAGSAINRGYAGPGTDVALIRLAGPIPAGYRPVTIYPQGQPIYRGDTVRLAGYGSDNTPNSFGILRAVTSYIMQRAGDGSLYVENGRTAACRGDSGGPLYLQRNGQWYTVGVTSTAFMDQNGACVGGNRYAPVQENYAALMEMGQRLTGRSDPFAIYMPTPDNPPATGSDFSQESEGMEKKQTKPEFQFAQDSFTETEKGFSLQAQNPGTATFTNCEFNMEITRRNIFFPTVYTVQAKLSSAEGGSTQQLAFDDFMANFKGLLGWVSAVSSPNFQCDQN
ncbi:MAG: S1 family peptidase [Oligoflexus sp.]